MESISDRLKSLGFKIASTLETVEKHPQKSLEEEIGGIIIHNSLGSFVLKEHFFPTGYNHGNVVFSQEIVTNFISKVAKIEDNPPALTDMLFLDTETSGLAGGSGTFAFLIGVGRFQNDGFHLQQLIIKDPAAESAMLLYLSELVTRSSAFVTFNGKSFDLPIINTRYILNKLPNSFRDNPHLDLLHISRKLWRKRIINCSLKDLEREILNFSRTGDDVPGWMIPEIYFEFLRTGDTKRISNVIYHNTQDIVSLAAVFIQISTMLENNIHIEDIHPSDRIAIGRIFVDLGSREIAEKIFMQSLDNKLSKFELLEVNKLLGKFYKYTMEFGKAKTYWETSADHEDLESCIELAKYFEHHEKEIKTAIFWAKKAQQILEKNEDARFDAKMKKAIEARINRLIRKEAHYV